MTFCGYQRPHDAHHVRDTGADCPGLARPSPVGVPTPADTRESDVEPRDRSGHNGIGGATDRRADHGGTSAMRDADPHNDSLTVSGVSGVGQ